MATKTFEELKQLAIQIRDEKTNKQNTATRVGTAMLEHINKLEQDYYDKNQTDEELKERDDKLIELDYKKIQIKGEFVWSDYFYNEGSKEIVKISSESNYRALIFNPIRNSNYVIKNVVDGFLGKFVYYKGSINNATFVSEQSISDGVIFTTPDTDFDFALANVNNVLSGLPYIGKMKFYLLNNTEKK